MKGVLAATITDEQLVQQMKNPATMEQGFRLLMQTYQERLYHHIRRMVITHEDANDVLQNVFIKVFKSIKNFKGDSKLYTWLYRIATNESITYLKKRNKRQSASIDESENGLANQLKADVYFDGDEIQIKLQQALNTLPEKQRLVFNMRYYDNMSYQDISDVLKTSVGALKASYHHAAKKIEAYLKSN